MEPVDGHSTVQTVMIRGLLSFAWSDLGGEFREVKGWGEGRGLQLWIGRSVVESKGFGRVSLPFHHGFVERKTIDKKKSGPSSPAPLVPWCLYFRRTMKLFAKLLQKDTTKNNQHINAFSAFFL